MNTILTAIDIIASVNKLDAISIIAYICIDAVNALFVRLIIKQLLIASIYASIRN